jgi:hypothetical protein
VTYDRFKGPDIIVPCGVIIEGKKHPIKRGIQLLYNFLGALLVPSNVML